MHVVRIHGSTGLVIWEQEELLIITDSNGAKESIYHSPTFWFIIKVLLKLLAYSSPNSYMKSGRVWFITCYKCTNFQMTRPGNSWTTHPFYSFSFLNIASQTKRMLCMISLMIWNISLFNMELPVRCQYNIHWPMLNREKQHFAG